MIETENSTLYLGDCMDILKTLPDNSVDSVITDPPYHSTDLKFDRGEPLILKCLDTLLNISKTNSYLACFGSIEILGAITQKYKYRFSGIWLKARPNMRTHSAKKPKGQYENFVVYAHPNHKISDLTWNKIYNEGEPYTRVLRRNGYKRDGKDQIDRSDSRGYTKDGYVLQNNGTREQTDVIKAPPKQCMKYEERTAHPTQKPLKVMETLIKWLTNENDLIIDPFMGSGTTGVAAIKTGRRFIGIEKEPEYFEIAKARIESAEKIAEQNLFKNLSN